MSVVLGIDTGGTFSDCVLVDEERGAITTAKVPSTPGDPASAIAAGLAELDGVDRLVVGTTVATNAVLERRGPTMIYITNRGFEDIPLIGRLDKARLSGLHWQKPKPMVQHPDWLGIGVDGPGYARPSSSSPPAQSKSNRSTECSASDRRPSSPMSSCARAIKSITERPVAQGSATRFGDPAARDPDLLREDIAEGFLSAEAAARDYGIVTTQLGVEA